MIKKSNILIVCQHFWPESFRVNDIAEYFIEENYSVDVLCGIPNYPSGIITEGYGYFKNMRQKYKGINIYRVPEVPRGSNSNIRIFLNYISFPITSLLRVPYLLTKRYDKIFIYQLSPVMMSIAGILIGKMKKVEITIYVLDLWPENLYSVITVNSPLLKKLASSVSHWHYRRADKIIALSEKMKSKLIETTNISPEKITVLPQTSEKLYEKDISDKEIINKFKDSFNIVFTGNISPAQSFDTILNVAEQLALEGYEKVKWIIVGDGMSRQEVQKKIKIRGLDKYFSFEGHKPTKEIPKYTHVADILVGCLVKSDLLEATIPAKVMSYIAAGKPIVLAMDGEVQDLINNKINCGFAGPTENVNEMTTNIKKVISMSKSERALLGHKAKDYHFKHFERNLVLNNMRNFIES